MIRFLIAAAILVLLLGCSAPASDGMAASATWQLVVVPPSNERDGWNEYVIEYNVTENDCRLMGGAIGTVSFHYFEVIYCEDTNYHEELAG